MKPLTPRVAWPTQAQFGRQIYWCTKHGLRVERSIELMGIPLGTVHRLSHYMGESPKWRLRVKRRKGGKTWRYLDESHPLVKRVKTEMLVMGIT